MVIRVAPAFFTEDGSSATLWLIRLAGIALLALSLQLLRAESPSLLHSSMIMIMPLLVLLILFMTLSEIKPTLGLIIALHLVALFVVSMVCDPPYTIPGVATI